jgi:transposase
MTTVRMFPIRLAPLPCEALDSWLEALMRRLDIARRDLTAALDLAEPRGRKVPPNWTVVLDRDVSEALSNATGVDPSTLAAMTLARYDGVALRLDHQRRVVIRTELWGRGTGSRYCPRCLEGSGGRWPLRWRLSWSFACVRHRCLLADTCPRCHGTPRTRQHWLAVSQPGRCDQPADPVLRGRALVRCGHDLTDTATTSLAPSSPAIRAQQILDEAIGCGTASFGVYATQPVPTAAMLADLTALASRVINDIPTGHLRRFLPTDLITVYETARALPLSRYRAARADARSGAMAPANAAITAAALTAAVKVLDSPDTPSGATMLRDLFAGAGAPGFSPHRPSAGAFGSHTTSTLTAIHLSSVGRWLTPSDQLRHRTATATPRRPDDRRSRAHCLPTMLWPWWSLRLSSPKMLHVRTVRPALACAAVIVGSTMSPSAAAAALGRPADPGHLARTLRILNTDTAWPQIASALTRLADHLDTDGSPIDYQRRRQLTYRDLLPADHWQHLCHQAGAPPGLDLRARSARCFLFERISGMPAELAPPAYAITTPAHRNALLELPAYLTPQLLAQLDNAAIEFLTSAGVHDEPVTWQPSPELATGLDLPGHDPDRVDIQALHDLLRQQERISLSRTAERLNTSIDVVRYLLESRPGAPASYPLTHDQARKPSLAAPRTTLRPDTFADLYHNQGLSLSEIARRFHLPRKTATLLAREYGINIRPHNAPRLILDQNRLHEQYVTQRRSIHDIATEASVGDHIVLRCLTAYDIPRRTPGGASHDQAALVLRDRETVPALLRPAMTGTHAWKRLKAFAALTRHSNYDTAATALGYHRATLRDYVQRLEKETGAVLLYRARSGRPLGLTRTGQDLLDAIDTATKLRHHRRE